MLKVTNQQLNESREALVAIEKIPLPAQAGYWIGKAIRRVKVALSDYDNARMRVIEKWAERDEFGKMIALEGRELFVKLKSGHTVDEEVAELSSIEIELQIPKLKLHDLGNNDIQIGHMMMLDWLICKQP